MEVTLYLTRQEARVSRLALQDLLLSLGTQKDERARLLLELVEELDGFRPRAALRWLDGADVSRLSLALLGIEGFTGDGAVAAQLVDRLAAVECCRALGAAA